MTRKRTFNSKLGVFLFRRALKWMQGKDALQAERIGQRLGRIAFRLVKKHRERCLANLAMVYPEKPAQWHRETAVKVFEHFGMVTTDFLRTLERSDEEVLAHMTIDGFERFNVVKELRRGVIVITAHFGNWERMAQLSRMHGHPLAVVARDANDPELNEMILTMRRTIGLEVLSRGSAAKAILKKLRENMIVSMLPDQNSAEAFIPFFGLPTGTVLGPAVLHLRTGAPIITAFCYRTGPGEYRTVVSGEIDYGDGTPEGIMASANAAIEAVIREHPEQYLWLHDRWKSARRKGLL